MTSTTIFLYRKNKELFRKSKDKYKDNMEVLRFVYDTYLANSLRSGYEG